MRPTYRHITVTSLRLWKDGSCSRSKLNTMGTSRQAIQSANRIYLRSLARSLACLLRVSLFCLSRSLSFSLYSSVFAFSRFLCPTKRQFPDGRAFWKCFADVIASFCYFKVTFKWLNASSLKMYAYGNAFIILKKTGWKRTEIVQFC